MKHPSALVQSLCAFEPLLWKTFTICHTLIRARFNVIKVPQVFELVEEFVSEVAISSRGRLLLLNGEPGGGMFCLELDRTVSFSWWFCAVLLWFGLLSVIVRSCVVCALNGRCATFLLVQCLTELT